MAPDDRERTFDKALARHLRPNASGEVHASQPACPDAEILAAYHERLLAPEQMISFKEHLAGCARCQEILAQLETTDELPVEVDQEEHQAQNVLTMPEVDLQVLAHAVGQSPMPAAPRATGATRVSRLRKATRGANWRWLAPAGALAAGLLVWISFHETKPPQFQLARNQQPATPSPAPAALPQRAVPANKEAVSKEVPGSSPDARAGARLESGAFTRNERAKLDEEKSAAGQADKLTASRGDLVPKQPSAPGDREARPSNITAGISAEEKEQKKQAVPSGLSPAPPPEIKDRPVDNLDVVANQVKSEALSKAKSVASPTGRQAPQAPQQEQQAVGAVAGLRESSALRMANARNSVTVAAPGATVLWRIASAGIIQHSTDAGSTWTVQTSGVVADLTAGSALSDKVCWIVGRSGTILRTTDGGAHWLKIRPPVADDLLAVFAVDAQQASVSPAQGSYQTMDGGRTWNKLLPE